MDASNIGSYDNGLISSFQLSNAEQGYKVTTRGRHFGVQFDEGKAFSVWIMQKAMKSQDSGGSAVSIVKSWLTVL
jgi:hypothetical protein